MPEVLVAVPPLQIPLESSSDIENSSTAAEVSDRSIDSRNHSPQVRGTEKKRSIKSHSKNKLRISCGRGFHKKHQLKAFTSERKVTGALKPKSRIPKALDPATSSSTTSFATNDTLPIAKARIEEKRLQLASSNTSCLVRQKTAVILAFRQRKSISQMDFNHARRQMNFPIPSPLNHHNKDTENGNALMRCHYDENMAVAPNSFAHKKYHQEYYFASSRHDPQMAGMRIFATIMLNAWRKRRDEVRRLIDEVADLKRSSIKARNQLHVFNTLFRSEKKRNEELNCQLKKSLEDINCTKSSCESLTTSLISLKADKALLTQQLQIKEQEFESINSLLTQTKTDLFKNMTVQREIQAALSMEQRKIQTLENQKNELINEICELNNEAMQKEHDLRKQIQQKGDELATIKKQLKVAEEQLNTLNESTKQDVKEGKTREESICQKIEALENEIKIMHKGLNGTLGNRLKSCWKNSATYPKITLQMLHWLSYYVLPATPPPKISSLPFGLSLDKALSILKR